MLFVTYHLSHIPRFASCGLFEVELRSTGSIKATVLRDFMHVKICLAALVVYFLFCPSGARSAPGLFDYRP